MVILCFRFMVQRLLFAIAVPVCVLGCSRAGRPETSGDWSTEVVPRSADALPAGAALAVELDQTIGAGSAAGTRFTMHLTQPVVALDLSTVLPQGGTVFGHVASVEPKRSGQPTLIRLEFDSLHAGSRRHPFSAIVIRAALPATVASPSAADSAAATRVGRVFRDSGSTPGSTISLGMSADAQLPAGTRLTLRSTRYLKL